MAMIVLAMAAPTWAQTQGGPTAAMVSVAGLPEVPVEAGFSDIWDNFDFGLAGRFEGRKNRFGFGLDFTYNNLGAPVASSAPVAGSLGLEADVRQLFMDIDYDNDGEGIEFRQFKLAYNGPRVWFAYSWWAGRRT